MTSSHIVSLAPIAAASGAMTRTPVEHGVATLERDHEARHGTALTG